MSLIVKLLMGVAIAYAIVVGAMLLLQRSFLYFPDKSTMDPERARFSGAATVEITTADGEKLVAWWRAPASDTALAYLYLHGNGGNLMLRGERLAYLTRDGSGVLALSWRGYGGSTGKPTEPGLHLDAAAAFAWLQQRVANKRIVVFGESLGSAPAVRLAADRDIAALVLDSPYSSAVDVAQARFPWLPVRLLMFDQLRAIDDAPTVKAPVLITHCRQDSIIALHFAEKLAAAFPTRPRFDILESQCHVPSLLNWRILPGDFVRQAKPS